MKKYSYLVIFLSLLLSICYAKFIEVDEMRFFDYNNFSKEQFSLLNEADKKKFLICQDLFKKNYSSNKRLSSATKIPKLIHFIWLGPRDFPESSIKNLISWKNLHPNWQIYFWTDSLMRDIPIPGVEKKIISDIDLKELKKHFDSSNNYGKKSDILRYQILEDYGGIYVDHDVYCYQKFDNVVYKYDFFCGMQPIIRNEINDSSIIPCNCLIGAIPLHPIIQQTIKNVDFLINEQLKTQLYVENYSTVITSTFAAFYDAIFEHSETNQLTNIVFPSCFFFPFSTVKNLDTLNFYKKNDLIKCNHSFQGTWL